MRERSHGRNSYCVAPFSLSSDLRPSVRGGLRRKEGKEREWNFYSRYLGFWWKQEF